MTNFKICTACGHSWEDRDSFLSDSDIKIIGYQVDFADMVDGLFLFKHICGTTFSIKVSMFQDFYNGPKYKNILTGSEKCSGYCLDKNELRSCGAECKYAYARELIQKIKSYKKTEITTSIV